MAKESAYQYALGLKKNLGIDQAYKVAEKFYKSVHPTEWSNLPSSKDGKYNIFTTSNKFNKFEKGRINLPKLNEFWKTVFFSLKKIKGNNKS